MFSCALCMCVRIAYIVRYVRRLKKEGEILYVRVQHCTKGFVYSDLRNFRSACLKRLSTFFCGYASVV